MIQRWHKNIALFCTISLLMQAPCMIASQTNISFQGPINYKELGDRIISSHGVVEQNPCQGKKDDEAVLDVMQLEKQVKRTIIFDLLARYEAMHPKRVDAYQQARYDAHRLVVDDVELFYANGQDHAQNIFTLFNEFVETTTGEAQLAQWLAQPTTDVSLLKARQAFIQELMHNPVLFQQCQEIVNALKEKESALCSFWMEDNKATQDLIAALYPSAEKGMIAKLFSGLNTSPAALEAYTRLGNLGTAMQCGGDIFIQAAQIILMARVAKNFFPNAPFVTPSFSKVLGIIGTMHWPFGFLKNFNQLRDPGAQTINLLNIPVVFPAQGQDPDKDFGRTIVKGINLYFGVVAMALIAQRAYVFKKGVEAANLTRKTANMLQERVMGAASCIHGLQKLDAVAHHNPLLVQGLQSYDSIQATLNGSLAQSAEFKELINALKTKTFKGEASFFSYTGRVLATYKRMQTHKQDLVPALQVLGELDAYLALAKLYKKFEAQRVKICFVDYVDQDKPYIKLENFWNPQVDAKVVVTNSLELGAPGKVHDIVLTGSNTGGKSTLLKGFIFDLWCAHTIGMAFAESMTTTLFDYIGSSMNIIDNTAQGKSLYQAEVDRAAKLINDARATQARGGKTILVMDELFRGTSAEKADKETAQCAQDLVDIETAIFILATHYFNNPTKLEQQTQGYVENWNVDAYIDEAGNVIRTFKLKKGISKNNIATEILQSALNKKRN